MISGSCWIRRGAAAAVPQKFEMTDEQYAEIMDHTRTEIASAKESLVHAQKKSKKTIDKMDISAGSSAEEDELAKFKLDEYSEDDLEGEVGMEGEGISEQFMEAFSNIDEAALNENDPILDKEEGKAAAVEDEEEDLDDLTIRQTDCLLAACRTEDDVSYLEVYVYEEPDDNLYVHHDIMLPSFPLCVEWIGQVPGGGQGSGGNFAAVGTFDPEIEIWNLDMLDVPVPALTLTPTSTSDKKKKSKSKGKSKEGSMNGATMSLSWNRMQTNLLLSGSADSSVRLWDLNGGGIVKVYDQLHSDKVQSVQWHPTEASVLASAAYDKKCIAFDCRTPLETHQWNLLNGVDPECLRWNPLASHTLTVSDEQGSVFCFDLRAGSNSSPLFTLSAHSKAVTAIDWNPAINGCLMTASADRKVKIWNTSGEITCLMEKDLGVGKIFSASFCSDAPHLVSAAGHKGVLQIWNLSKESTIIEGFNLSA